MVIALATGHHKERGNVMGTRTMQPPMGLYFEEFTLGDGCESVGRTVTEADIVNFAALSGDWNRIHTDEQYSREQMFGERVAHGLLVLSVASDWRCAWALWRARSRPSCSWNGSSAGLF